MQLSFSPTAIAAIVSSAVFIISVIGGFFTIKYAQGETGPQLQKLEFVFLAVVCIVIGIASFMVLATCIANILHWPA